MDIFPSWKYKLIWKSIIFNYILNSIYQKQKLIKNIITELEKHNLNLIYESDAAYLTMHNDKSIPI